VKILFEGRKKIATKSLTGRETHKYKTKKRPTNPSRAFQFKTQYII